MKSKSLCIIPARGGSKRIPRKNIRDFLGKPIIAYSIENALESGLFAEVMVSTDDEEIAEIARSYGAEVPFMRSGKNADDHATTVDVLLEVLNAYGKSGKTFETTCCIYPTAPLMAKADLEKGFRELVDQQRDVVFPVTEFTYPIRRGLHLDEKSKVEPIWPEYAKTRSQDLIPAYHDAGQWYWFRSSEIVKKKTLFTNNTGGILLNSMQVQDIDTESDWKLAALKYELLQGTP